MHLFSTENVRKWRRLIWPPRSLGAYIYIYIYIFFYFFLFGRLYFRRVRAGCRLTGTLETDPNSQTGNRRKCVWGKHRLILLYLTNQIILYHLTNGAIHKVRTLGWWDVGSSQKRTPYMKLCIFPIKKAYKGEGGQKLVNMSVRTIWLAPMRIIITVRNIYLRELQIKRFRITCPNLYDIV